MFEKTEDSSFNERKIMKCVSLVFIAMFALQLLAGCTTKYAKVDEYLQVPAYQGYLPVNENKVRADWILPIYKEEYVWDYTLPPSKEAAEKLVMTNTEKSELHPVAEGMLAAGAGITLPITMIPALFLYMGVGIIDQAVGPDKCDSSYCEYYGHLNPKITEGWRNHDPKKQRKLLAEMAGTKLKITVKGPSGAPVQNASIYEVVSPIEVPLYGSNEKNRSFAVPTNFASYPLTESALKALKDHLPIYLGIKIKYLLSDVMLGKANGFWQCDQEGFAEYTSMAHARFARYSVKKGWHWSRKPLPLDIHLIVWAPGFNPGLYSITGAKPQEEHVVNIHLEPLPDSAFIQKKHTEFLKEIRYEMKSDVLSHSGCCALNPTIEWLNDYGAMMTQWIKDEKSPGYIRWNAYSILSDLRRQLYECKGKWTKLNKSEVEAPILTPQYKKKYMILDKMIASVEGETKSLTPYLEDSSFNPWRFRDEYQSIMKDVQMEGMKPETVHKVQALLVTGEKIFPDYPQFDNLKALIAISENKKDEAFLFSRNMEHHKYFKLFYKLDLVGPHEYEDPSFNSHNQIKIKNTIGWLDEINFCAEDMGK